MAIFNVLFFMAQVLAPWERQKIRDETRFDLEQKKLLTLTRDEVKHQLQTIETQTKTINKCERLNEQLLQTISNLRTDNTALRQKYNETNALYFELRHAYQYLQQEYHELENSYLENVDKLHILQNNFPR